MLTTTAHVLRYLVGKAEIPSDHEDEIQRIITAVSEDLEAFCGRRFAQADYVDERLAGAPGSGYLYPRQWPITQVQAVVLKAGFPAGEDETLEAGDDLEQYRLIPNQWDEPHVLFRRIGWPTRPYSVSITYQAGYTEFPDLLVDAATQLAAERYLFRGRTSLSSHAFEGLSMTFSPDLWPRDVKDRLLRRFVRHRHI